MDRKTILLKGLAVVSAVAIGATYIAWRNAEAQKARESDQAEGAKPPVEEDEEPTLIVGSKSMGGAVFTEGTTREEIDAVLKDRRTGSDFITPITPEEDDSVLPELDEENEVEKPLLPSSKIGIIQLPKKEEKPAKKKDPKLLPSSKRIDSILENPNRK